MFQSETLEPDSDPQTGRVIMGNTGRKPLWEIARKYFNRHEFYGFNEVAPQVRPASCFE